MSDQPTKDEYWRTRQAELQDKLARFEERVEAPFIPGELDEWLEATGDALGQLVPHLQLYAEHVHAAEFDEIAEEDPELFNRVEMMREEDQFISTRTDQIRRQLEDIRNRHGIQKEENEGGSETELKQDLDQFVSDAMEWVMRIHKQEVSIRTWLVEAFTRDRGVID